MSRRRTAYELTETAAPARDRVYVIARTNAGRPSLQHLLPPGVGLDHCLRDQRLAVVPGLHPPTDPAGAVPERSLS